jgi:TetR/AcrR family tetracycline transcriptional repressor
MRNLCTAKESHASPSAAMLSTVQEREPLTRGSIVSAALTLVGEVGLDVFSMRRLAQQLDVKSPALYWHFRSRVELLSEAAEVLIMGAGMGAPVPGESWQQWMSRRSVNYRQSLLSQRDGARIVASARGASRGLIRQFNDEVAALIAFGFSPKLSMQTIAIMTHFISGFVLKEQTEAEGSLRDPGGAAVAMQTFVGAASPEVMEAFAAGADPLNESVFVAGLKAIITGTAVELEKVS